MGHLVFRVFAALGFEQHGFVAAHNMHEFAAREIGFEQPLGAMRVNRVAQARAPRAPCAKVVAQAAIFKFHRHIARAFALHPRRAEIRAHVRAAHGSAQKIEQQVDVVTPVAEQLPAAQPLFARCPMVRGIARELLGPNRHLKHIAIRLGVQQGFQALYQGMKAHAIRDHQHFARFFRGFYQFLARHFVIGHGFFEQDVNARIEARLPHGKVQVMGQREQYRVNRSQNLAVIRGRDGVGKVSCYALCAFPHHIDSSGQ